MNRSTSCVSCAVAALVAGVSLTGCAQTRLSHQPGFVTTWDRTTPRTPMPNAPKLAIILHTRYLMFGEPGGSFLEKRWSKSKIRHQLDDVIGEFPVLQEATWDHPDPTYRFVIEATHAIRGNKTRHWVSTTTYFLIPTAEEAFVELEGRLSRGQTLLKTYEAVGSYKIKRQLLLLLSPWWWGYRVPSHTMEDTFRDLFIQLQQDAPTIFTAGGVSS